MRKSILLAALASAAATSPAMARDGSGYVAVEGGVMKVEDVEVDLDLDGLAIDDGFTLDMNTGIDVDLVGGYDFGLFRVEGEVGYKRASVDEIRIDEAVDPDATDLQADGRARVLSGMVNAMFDFGDDDGMSGFLGGGAGIARVKIRSDLTGTNLAATSFSGRDRAFARQAISNNVDLGLKYRFFNTKFDFQDGGDQLDGRFRSHSLLASLTYNFAPPPAPPPPPPPPAPVAPPPPATQTCPDGSVILATDVCPVPPPPPPPPPPAPERG